MCKESSAAESRAALLKNPPTHALTMNTVCFWRYSPQSTHLASKALRVKRVAERLDKALAGLYGSRALGAFLREQFIPI